MTLDFLVEERSMARFLELVMERIVPGVKFDIRTFSGKPDLLKKLPDRLRGYKYGYPKDHRVVILVDRDNDDCSSLKETLLSIVNPAGLTPASRFDNSDGRVLVRIVIEELEAWLLGDVGALRRAYPRLPASLGDRARFRNPDAIAGGTAEALEKVLIDSGNHLGGLQKVTLVENVAPYMDPSLNRSGSFMAFIDGVKYITRAL